MFLGQNATFEFWILESFLRTKNLAEYLKIFTKKKDICNALFKCFRNVNKTC